MADVLNERFSEDPQSPHCGVDMLGLFIENNKSQN